MTSYRVGERKEWIKPIMFSGGIGSIDSNFIEKEKPKPGMLVTKIGGPVYRIGVGGGAASSVEIQGNVQVIFSVIRLSLLSSIVCVILCVFSEKREERDNLVDQLINLHITDFTPVILCAFYAIFLAFVNRRLDKLRSGLPSCSKRRPRNGTEAQSRDSSLH